MFNNEDLLKLMDRLGMPFNKRDPAYLFCRMLVLYPELRAVIFCDLSEVPLHVNDPEPVAIAATLWRLEIAK